MRRLLTSIASITLLALLVALAGPSEARAFCGFYVAGSDRALHNHATTVVLMREGHRTVLSMQNDYAGAPEDFAMVVPVPTVLRRDDVRTLERSLFERVERLTGPRLVEYWEQDPCADLGTIGLGGLGTIGHGGGGTGQGYGLGGARELVRVEARFAVGEYDVVVLGADDSSALETWLRAHDYQIPAGAAEALRPYVEAGMKFFVARVDVDRVRFENGRAVLSPLRMHYDTPELSLPVRLGLLSSAGEQDLVVVVLARQRRFEVANYPNVFVPTNLDVSNDVREDFGAFYEALLDRTLERHPGAVVTEYSWQATTCDPCPPDATLDAQMLTSLGGDVLFRDGVQPPGIGRGAGWFSGGGAVPLRLGTPTGTGLSPTVVTRILRRHMNELRFCHEQALASDPSVTGTLDVRFTVDVQGAVTQADAVARNGTLPDAVTNCVERRVHAWTFPAPEGGAAELSFDVTLGTGTPSPRADEPPPTSASASEFVATRLHYRYGRDGLGEDLVFREASAVVGGRENRGLGGTLEEGAQPSFENNFQARYAIRHGWDGPIACETPVRGRWGGPPRDADDPARWAGIGMGLGSVAASVAPAHVAPLAEGQTRTPVAIETVVYTPVTDLGIAGRDASTDATTPPPSTSETPASTSEAPANEALANEAPANGATAAAPEASSGFCATHTSRRGAGGMVSLAFGTLLLFVARRRRRS